MTIISHIYNEEFLLPWWLTHHRQFFGHGIIIDYASTDRSLDIIRELCPTWEIHQSVNTEFDAYAVDREVESYERNIIGPRIALNTTEFLYGPYHSINSDTHIYIPSHYFVDPLDLNTTVDLTKPLHDQFNLAVRWQDDFGVRRARLFHNNPNIQYPVGRHFSECSPESGFVIFSYGQAPMTEEFIARKLQIQHKIPISHRLQGVGFQHYAPGGALLERELLIERKNSYYLSCAKDVSEDIKTLLLETYKNK